MAKTAPIITALKSLTPPSFPVQDKWKVEGSATYPKQGGDPNTNPYSMSFRFTPIAFYKPGYFMLRHFFMEFLATFMYLYPVFACIASGQSFYAVAFVKGGALSAVLYTFWYYDMELPRLNHALSVVLWGLGHYTWGYILSDWVAQAAGAFAASGIVWGFYGADGGSFRPSYDPAKFGITFAYEIFGAWMLFFLIGLIYSTPKLFVEGVTREKPQKSPSGYHLMTPLAYVNNKENHIDRFGSSLQVGMLVGIFCLSAVTITGGVYNIWLWLPHAFVPATINSSFDLGMDFILYFFGDIIGGIGSCLFLYVVIFWVRRGFVNAECSEMENANKDLQNNPGTANGGYNNDTMGNTDIEQAGKKGE